MIDAEVVPMLVAAGLVGAGIIVAPMRHPRRPSAGKRLLAHARDRSDYRMFVGVPTASPEVWVEIATVTVPTVATCGSRTFPLEEVQAFFVAYPRGNLLEYHCPGNLPLPP